MNIWGRWFIVGVYEGGLIKNYGSRFMWCYLDVRVFEVGWDECVFVNGVWSWKKVFKVIVELRLDFLVGVFI